MGAEFARVGGVKQVAGVGLTHLEEHTHAEFTQTLMIKIAVDVVEVVAPDEQMDAQAGTVAENGGEVVGGTGVFHAAGEAEIVGLAAEFAEAGQVVDEDENLGTIGRAWLLATVHLGGDLG